MLGCSSAAIAGFEERYPSADDDEKVAFQAVLALADPELNSYLLQRKTHQSEPIARVIEHILRRAPPE